MSSLDITSLRLAVLCLDAGSLKEAARQVQLSTSAASQRLTSLERDVGVPLYVREHRGLQVTKFGHGFVERARTVLHEVEALMTHVEIAARSQDAALQALHVSGHSSEPARKFEAVRDAAQACGVMDRIAAEVVDFGRLQAPRSRRAGPMRVRALTAES